MKSSQIGAKFFMILYWKAKQLFQCPLQETPSEEFSVTYDSNMWPMCQL